MDKIIGIISVILISLYEFGNIYESILIITSSYFSFLIIKNLNVIHKLKRYIILIIFGLIGTIIYIVLKCAIIILWIK